MKPTPDANDIIKALKELDLHVTSLNSKPADHSPAVLKVTIEALYCQPACPECECVGDHRMNCSQRIDGQPKVTSVKTSLGSKPEQLSILEEFRAVLEGQDLFMVNGTYATVSNDPDTLIIDHAIIARPTRQSPAARAIEQERRLQEKMERIKYIGETEGRIPRVKDDS